jgi:hypothetical protein
VENISISGLLIRTASPFPQDQVFTVRFPIPSSEDVIECRARVAHCVPEVFMGAEFVDLAPGAAAVIEQYVAEAPALQAKTRQ